MSSSSVRATLLLCDAAQEANGKLYILGGGWSRTTNAGLMALAIKLYVPWSEANRQLRVRADLLTQDGVPVIHDGKAVTFPGKLEVGRPPGLRAGTELDAPFALTVAGLDLLPGFYRWDLFVDAERLASASFEVLTPPTRSS